MLKSILKVDTAKLDQLDCTNKLSKYELKVIKEVTDILSPFEMVTEKCQAQNEVTAGLIILCVRGLKEEMKEMQDTFKSKMVSTLLASLEKRLKKYEEMPSLQIASALDPRFKLQWCSSEEARELKAMLELKLAAVNQQETTDAIVVQSKRKSKIFKFMGTTQEPRIQGPSSASELGRYLEQPVEDVDPLQYWQTNRETFPHLAKMAVHHLPVVASSAPVERLFSIAGKIFKPDRALLSDTRFEELMFLRCNSHL